MQCVRIFGLKFRGCCSFILVWAKPKAAGTKGAALAGGRRAHHSSRTLWGECTGVAHTAGSAQRARQALGSTAHAAVQGAIARPSSLALTMEGAALGICSKGPSTKGSTSALFQAGWPCRVAATLQAARVACSQGGSGEKRGEEPVDPVRSKHSRQRGTSRRPAA